MLFQVKGFPDERYQIRDTFYFYQQELEINKCWFRVPKSRQATDRFAVEIIAYNGAMLQAQQVVDVDLNSFKGIGQCKGHYLLNLLRKMIEIKCFQVKIKLFSSFRKIKFNTMTFFFNNNNYVIGNNITSYVTILTNLQLIFFLQREDQAVKDVNLLQNTGNGVRFSFNLTESCYRRQNIILKYNDGQAHEKLINPSADKYDLLGLQPLTAYNVSFVVEYDEGDTSDPLFYSFRTGCK